MCLSCLTMNLDGFPLGLDRPSRRDMLQRVAALGISLPMATAAFSRTADAAEQAAPSTTELTGGIKAIIANANSAELIAYRTFEINGSDLPWTDLGLIAEQGQQVTFLLSGRMWLSREYDLWFEPGLVFHARTRGTKPIYNPMNNSGTMIAAHGGIIEVARSAGEWADESGSLWTPEEAYRKADVKIVGVALLWRDDAARGLKTLLAQGDVGGLLQAELSRLDSDRQLPDGWSNLFLFGGGPVVFSKGKAGEILCQTHKNVSIIERPIQLPLTPGTRLSWRWLIEELPSILPEDQAAAHDYLSIGVKFEDGQDLTYIWSQTLPQGKVFRCPLPRWTGIETHMIVRSGKTDLGTWLSEERDIAADYSAHIQGPAKAISHVWLLGVSPFQRRTGSCRYADIHITTPEGKNYKI